MEIRMSVGHPAWIITSCVLPRTAGCRGGGRRCNHTRSTRTARTDRTEWANRLRSASFRSNIGVWSHKRLNFSASLPTGLFPVQDIGPRRIWWKGRFRGENPVVTEASEPDSDRAPSALKAVFWRKLKTRSIRCLVRGLARGSVMCGTSLRCRYITR